MSATFITEPSNMEIAVTETANTPEQQQLDIAPINDSELNIPTTQPKDYKFKAMHIKHRYAENTPARHRQYETLEELIADIHDPNDCVYEVLDKPMRRIYMDLECIETEDHARIVSRIIQEFKEFTGIKAAHYITFNAGSKGHPGASYHVVFDAKANYILQKNIILAFKHIHQEYKNYIDESVYSVFRLFRLPNQCKQRDQDVPDPTDVHLIFTPNATEESMVIQNTYMDIPEITVDSLSAETVRQIGLVALESKRPVNNKGRSGNYAPREFVETVATQMTEIKDSNVRLERKIEQLEKINSKLFDALAKLLGTREIPME